MVISMKLIKLSNDTYNTIFRTTYKYIEKLTEVNIDDIWKTLSSHEVQVKSRLLGDMDSNMSTNEIINGKKINIKIKITH